jgi:hypothetical protein
MVSEETPQFVVIVTQYVPGLVTVIFAVVSFVFHKNDGDETFTIASIVKGLFGHNVVSLPSRTSGIANTITSIESVK